ncbi:MAG: biotin/lipoyl-containing protein [Candidatus Limnocylindrales bacterium]
MPNKSDNEQPKSGGEMSDAESRAVIARLTTDTLPRLIERLSRSQLGELEVREDGWRIRLRRPMAVGTTPQAADQRGSRHHGAAAAPDRASAAHRPPQSARPESDRGRITSPGVGYFIAQDGVKVGSVVRRGDLVGHVNVLGVRQEVVAPIDGTLKEIEVEQGQAIEYGQRLARVEAG